jgi:hypothetical protein
MNSNNVVRVAIEIYDAQKKNELHTFSSLVKVLNGRISRNEISICVDILTDITLLNWKWVQSTSSGKCRFDRIMRITDVGIPLIDKWTKQAIAE